jgi:hypothetical protein
MLLKDGSAAHLHAAKRVNREAAERRIEGGGAGGSDGAPPARRLEPGGGLRQCYLSGTTSPGSCGT